MNRNNRGFTLNCRAESSLLSISTAQKAQGRDPEQKHLRMGLCKGFTLVELLVVVLIIGVLAAIAVPQYQKAVLKSQYHALMPAVEALYQAERFHYLEKGKYASNAALDDLETPVKRPSNIYCSANVTYNYVYCKISSLDIAYLRYFDGRRACVAYNSNSRSHELCAKETKRKYTSSGTYYY